MKKIGVLTTVDANHGSSIFNNALNRMLARCSPDYDVRFIRHLSIHRYGYEILRAMKPNMKIPFYNLRRYKKIIDFEYDNLLIDNFPVTGTYESHIREMHSRAYDALIVAKVLWDFSTKWFVPRFPNIYWLASDISAIKIAYAISGHRSDLTIFRKYKDQVRRILSSYKLISVRDDITMTMMLEAKVDKEVPVSRIADPAFMYEYPEYDDDILRKYGIAGDRPILGLLLYGQPMFSANIATHYRDKGYIILNFNMFNRFADYNIGHSVDPYEWAAFFKKLSFCITDRFHCSVMCLKNNIPFVATEPFMPQSIDQSKIYSLLKEFGVTQCYQNTLMEGFDITGFKRTCEEIQEQWVRDTAPHVAQKCAEALKQHSDFIDRIKYHVT
ncbi:MAG: polysaccharide pyruvyl transferase family protein [Candidatus Omnitrophica bacterium]|nr:polysaccharide pyruvyl transferase family protein [Candidatus Omnitrophota bacterium]